MLEEFTAWAEPWHQKPNRSAWQETSTSPPPNVTSSTGRATKRQVIFYPMNAPGSPTCCNADGTTPCVIKQVNATVRTPGGRIADKLVRWIGMADRSLAPQRRSQVQVFSPHRPPRTQSRCVRPRPRDNRSSNRLEEKAYRSVLGRWRDFSLKQPVLACPRRPPPSTTDDLWCSPQPWLLPPSSCPISTWGERPERRCHLSPSRLCVTVRPSGAEW